MAAELEVEDGITRKAVKNIGESFVKQYYLTFDTNRSLLAGLYVS